jgi:hypothetical protein
VVPSKAGGCDAFGWNPDSTEEVTDLGAEAHYRQRLKGVLRVTHPRRARLGLIEAR